MKKTLVTLFALAGVAMAETLYTVNDIITLPTSGVAAEYLITKGANTTWATMNWPNVTAVTAANMTTNIVSNAALADDGWHYFFANGTANNTDTTDFCVGTKDNAQWLGLGSRKVSGGGTILTVTKSVSDIITAPWDTVTDLSFSITSANDATEYFGTSIGGTTNDVYYALFAIDSANQVTAIIPMQGNGVTAITKGATTTIEAHDLSLTSADKIMLAIRNGSTGWAQEFVITELSSSATVKTPEPATATLSLLALAGLASRRRRH